MIAKIVTLFKHAYTVPYGTFLDIVRFLNLFFNDGPVTSL